MDILSGRRIFLLSAMLATVAMLLGTLWIGNEAFDNFVNGFGLCSGHYSRVYEADIYGARK